VPMVLMGKSVAARVLLLEPLPRPEQRGMRPIRHDTRSATSSETVRAASQEPEQVPGADARAVGELVPRQALVVSESQEHPPERGSRKTRLRHGGSFQSRV
jgi:hypothetical protein